MNIAKFYIFTLILVIMNFKSVSAQDNTITLNMGMLDVNWVTKQSLLAKDIARNIKNKRKVFMREIKAEELQLRKIDNELQKKKVVLSAAAFAEESRIFREKANILRKKVQTRNQELSRFRAKANQVLNKAIQTALMQITKRDKLNLVFRYTPELILVRPDALDISAAVLAQLNKNSSKFPLPVSSKNLGK